MFGYLWITRPTHTPGQTVTSTASCHGWTCPASSRIASTTLLKWCLFCPGRSTITSPLMAGKLTVTVGQCGISRAFSALTADPSSYTIQTVYSYVRCRSPVCTRLHHQSGYIDISYVRPVTSSLCRQPHLRHLSDADEDGRSCTVGRWSTAMKRTSCWHSVCTQSRHIPFPPIDSIWAMMFVWR